MPTESYAGNASITTTEYSCPNAANYAIGSPITADGAYQAILDLSDMVAGDELQIRIYEKVGSGSTQRLFYQANKVGIQSQALLTIPTFILVHGWDLTLKTINGTSITVSWSIRSVASTITEAYAGTEAVGTTEHSAPNDSTTLTPITADGVYQIFLDLSDMTTNDELLIKVLEKVESAGTQRIIWSQPLTNSQSPPITVFPGLTLLHGWDLTLDTIAGTSITVDWSIRKVG